jgi:5-methyltetrahydropteroyltriglutamate--homocysteine methyltransferase
VAGGNKRQSAHAAPHLSDESEHDIRRSLEGGARCVQIDFTEARLSAEAGSVRRLVRSFIELNNVVLGRFSAEERARIGVHACPGSDRDSTHSADVEYASLLPTLLVLKAGNFYVQLAGKGETGKALRAIRENLRRGRDQLGTTDDCGFSPSSDDTSTAQSVTFSRPRSVR